MSASDKNRRFLKLCVRTTLYPIILVRDCFNREKVLKIGGSTEIPRWFTFIVYSIGQESVTANTDNWSDSCAGLSIEVLDLQA